MESKKNTDCVYFLASPFTCKKGMQCEFRHSEVARLNPRDCWYWLSGNCLNPDCAFRHPPLDTEEQKNSSPEPTTSKARVPCYFFSQGFCAKGDKCSFMHGYSRVFSNPNSSSQAGAAPPRAAEAPQAEPKAPAETIVTVVPEEEKKIDECCSFQRGEEPGMKLDWPRASSPGYEEGAAAEQELYEAYEGEEEEEDEEEEQVEEEDDGDDEDVDMVLNPGNVPQYHPAGAPGLNPGYELDWSLQSCSGAHRDYDCKLFDPPYQPSAPYDCMISSRQAMAEERRLEPEIEALLMARNFGMNHSRRLEDRLVFPKNNAIANRVKFLSSANPNLNNNSSSSGREFPGSLYSPGFRGRVENVRRVSNGGILSRLGSSRPSIKSRLRYTNQRQQQQQQQQQQQSSVQNHHHHRHSKSARYLGIVRQQSQRRAASRVPKRPGKQQSRKVSNLNLINNIKASGQFNSQFDGPKSLAELKAAKLVDSS